MPREYQAKPHSSMQPAIPDARRQKPVTRAFPEGTEVLTEHGFYLFEDLLNDDLFEGEVEHAGKGLPQSWKTDDLPYTLYKPGANFPRVASVDPKTGAVVYATPTLFRSFVYDGFLSQIKMKGVDILTTRYADLLLKGKYAREWSFTLADNVSRHKASGSNYLLLDKFNQDLYGEYEPREGLRVRLDAPITLYPMKHAVWRKVDDLFPLYAVDAAGHRQKIDRTRTEINVYNVDIEPHHTLIIRRGRKNNNPRTPWIGNPVVVGDGSDKSVARFQKLLALKDSKEQTR